MKFKVEDFMGFTQTVNIIICTKCNLHYPVNEMDEWDAITHFIQKGWRATEKHCYCPKCAKKYLKS